MIGIPTLSYALTDAHLGTDRIAGSDHLYHDHSGYSVVVKIRLQAQHVVEGSDSGGQTVRGGAACQV